MQSHAADAKQFAILHQLFISEIGVIRGLSPFRWLRLNAARRRWALRG
jgi:hypothetical protein